MANPGTNTNSSSSVQVGPGFMGLCVLASIVLAILKLTNVWAISWLVVVLPVLAGFGFIIVLFIIFIIFVAIIAAVQG